MKFTSIRDQLAGVVGNMLEHYDSALYGFLSPFLAPLFFRDHDPISALIFTYAIIPLGLFTRPLGSLFFGWIGDRFGRRQALSFSLLGMAIVTVGIGSLPTSHEVGVLAPLLLAIGKMLQSFCAAGESTGGAIFVLEHTQAKKRGLMSSFYDVSSMVGILAASGIISLMGANGLVETYWRVLFWAGGATAILGFVLRRFATEGKEFAATAKIHRDNVIRTLLSEKTALFGIVIAAGFSYTTYSLAFTLMNGYIPLVTSLSNSDVLQVNTALLVFDMLLLPFFGFLTQRFGKERVMLAGALCAVMGAIPLFMLLDGASLATVIFVRVAIITFGVAFAAPYHAWAMERVPPHHRYLILAFGYAIGSQLIGSPTASVCLWLYKTLEWSAAPGFYLAGIGACASLVVYYFMQKEKAELPAY